MSRGYVEYHERRRRKARAYAIRAMTHWGLFALCVFAVAVAVVRITWEIVQ